VDISLYFDENKAICGAYVFGKSSVNKITAGAILQRKNSDGTYTTLFSHETGM